MTNTRTFPSGLQYGDRVRFKNPQRRAEFLEGVIVDYNPERRTHLLEDGRWISASRLWKV